MSAPARGDKLAYVGTVPNLRRVNVPEGALEGRPVGGDVKGLTDAETLARLAAIGIRKYIGEGLDLMDTPPVSPTPGDAYLIGSAATDGWTGHEGEFAIWDGADWVFEDPNDGDLAFNVANQTYYLEHDDSWISTKGLELASGVYFYFDDSGSDIGGYNYILREPDTVAVEEEDSAESTAGEVLIDQYISEPDDPSLTIIPSGVWQFQFWAKVNLGGLNSYVRFKVYSRASGGLETLLFTATSAPLSISYPSEHAILTSVQGDFLVDVTDRIVIKVYAYVPVGTRTVYYLHNGTTRYSHVLTPIVQPIPSAGDAVSAATRAAILAVRLG